MTIYKLQRPLNTCTGDILAYTEGYKDVLALPINPEFAKLFGGKAKIYVECELRGMRLAIVRVIPEKEEPSW